MESARSRAASSTWLSRSGGTSDCNVVASSSASSSPRAAKRRARRGSQPAATRSARADSSIRRTVISGTGIHLRAHVPDDRVDEGVPRKEARAADELHLARSDARRYEGPEVVLHE